MRILVVEDEHRIAQTIKKGLEQEHYVVDIAFDGQTGYDLASSEEYGVLVLDLMLPQKDGLTICRELRSHNIHTPILMLTAKGQTSEKITGLDAGADDYLTKPFSFDELVARIRALSRRPQTTTSPILKFQDLTLDPKEYVVARDGQNIDLSHKEFSLLEYLMRHAQKILSKQQIIANVWDYDADILPNTVEVYVRNLRTKIDKPFKNKPPLLKTLRGFGYKLGG